MIWETQKWKWINLNFCSTYKLFSPQIWFHSLYSLWNFYSHWAYSFNEEYFYKKIYTRIVLINIALYDIKNIELNLLITWRKYKLSLIRLFAKNSEQLTDCPNKCARFVLCWFWPIFLTLSQEELYILTAKYFIFSVSRTARHSPKASKCGYTPKYKLRDLLLSIFV